MPESEQRRRRSARLAEEDGQPVSRRLRSGKDDLPRLSNTENASRSAHKPEAVGASAVRTRRVRERQGLVEKSASSDDDRPAAGRKGVSSENLKRSAKKRRHQPAASKNVPGDQRSEVSSTVPAHSPRKLRSAKSPEKMATCTSTPSGKRKREVLTDGKNTERRKRRRPDAEPESEPETKPARKGPTKNASAAKKSSQRKVDASAGKVSKRKRRLRSASESSSEPEVKRANKESTKNVKSEVKKKPARKKNLSSSDEALPPEDYSYPCRNAEFMEVYDFIRERVEEALGGCMYISGMPGTGKTATVHRVIDYLSMEVDRGRLSDFVFCEINGMKLSDPRQAYVVLAKCRFLNPLQRTGLTFAGRKPGLKSGSVFMVKKVLESTKKMSHATALRLLDGHFRSSEAERQRLVVVVDEMDMLYAKRQKVLYNLFEWPQLPNSQLIIISIANTMDLPERMLMARVESRLGLQRLAFQPYTSAQLEEVVKFHLKDIMPSDEAMMLASKRIASISGDARRVLDICKRARNIAEAKLPLRKGKVPISVGDIQAACDDLMSSPKFNYIKCASTLEKMLLRSIVAEYERTGTEEAVFEEVLNHIMEMTPGKSSPSSVAVCLAVARKLASVEVIVIETKCPSIFRSRMSLNCGIDDVNFATK